MKPVLVMAILAVAASAILPRRLLAQGCADDQAMVQDSEKTLTDLVDTVKKESLQDFENKYHQKTGASNLSFFAGLVGELVTCLDKASQDPAATPDQKVTYKTQHEAAIKLKDKADRSRSDLKAAASSKDAKAIIEKLDLAN